MEVDERRGNDRPGELKIKGQAAAERKQGSRDDDDKVRLTVSSLMIDTHTL